MSNVDSNWNTWRKICAIFRVKKKIFDEAVNVLTFTEIEFVPSEWINFFKKIGKNYFIQFRWRQIFFVFFFLKKDDSPGCVRRRSWSSSCACCCHFLRWRIGLRRTRDWPNRNRRRRRVWSPCRRRRTRAASARQNPAIRSARRRCSDPSCRPCRHRRRSCCPCPRNCHLLKCTKKNLKKFKKNLKKLKKI